MYFLEHKESVTRPNYLNGRNEPIHTYEWKAVAVCESREPLEAEIKKLDSSKYRITSNNPFENRGDANA